MSSKPNQTFLQQNFLDLDVGKVQYVTMEESKLGKLALNVFGDNSDPVGISPGYSPDGRLITLAIANEKKCLIVKFPGNKRGKKGGSNVEVGSGAPGEPSDGRKRLQELVLCRSLGAIYAFDLGPLSMSLYSDYGLRITNGVDIQSAFPDPKRRPPRRTPLEAIEACLGDSVKIFSNNIRYAFKNDAYDGEDSNHIKDLVMRAWVSQFLPKSENGAMEAFDQVPKIDTLKLSDPVSTISRCPMQNFLLCFDRTYIIVSIRPST